MFLILTLQYLILHTIYLGNLVKIKKKQTDVVNTATFFKAETNDTKLQIYDEH